MLGPWLMLRVVLSLIAFGASSARPQPNPEGGLQASPVSATQAAWGQRLFLEPWQRWDAPYYEMIAARGYRQGDGTLQFHPLYPLLGRVTGRLMAGNIVAGLLTVSSVSGLLFLLVFSRLAALDLPPDDARRAATLFLHWPVAFILFAPYSEALFLLCSVLLFLMARRGSWWLAGVAGGLAALTRQQGVFLALPLAYELWEWCGRDLSKVLSRWRTALSVLLVPAGLLVWLVYRARTFGDVVLDLYSPQTWIYGLLISTDAKRVVEEQHFVLPWNAVAAALNHPRSTTIFDLVLASLFLAVFVVGGRALWRLRQSYFLYATVILLVSFSLNTGSYQPYMGLPRHCLLAFPIFLPLAIWARRPRMETTFLGIGLLGMAVLTYCYSARILWVP